MKKWTPPGSSRLKRTTRLGLLALAAAALPACKSDSLFEGEPVIAPPVTAFDREASAESAIHGGVLPISVTAEDPYVGIDSLMVRYSGALTGSFIRRYAEPPKTARIDTVLNVPFGVSGPVVFEAFALNRYGSTAQVDTLLVQLLLQDTIRPITVQQQVTLPARLELRDSIVVNVQAKDDSFGGGIARLGVIVKDLSTTAAAATFTYTLPAAAATAQRDIRIPVAQLPGTATPRERDLSFIAFAVDQAGNCTAVGATGTPVPCVGATGQPVDPTLAGVLATTQVTSTRTLANAAPTAAQIGDLVVDPDRGLLYVSNQANNSVDRISFNGAVLARTGRALVGSKPLGLALDLSRDTLIVANSGGTSLSYVAVNAFTESRRFETPNVALWQMTGEQADTAQDTTATHKVGSIEVTYTDFSDRPQYVGVDATGLVLYSTSAAGAIRAVSRNTAWQQAEANILLWSDVITENDWISTGVPETCFDTLGANVLPCVLTGVDSVRLIPETVFDSHPAMAIYDHEPGFPGRIIADTGANLYTLYQNLRNAGSDLLMVKGTWQYSFWQNPQPTFVTASLDHSWVNVAEGEGRMWLWGASQHPPGLFDRLITDFINIDDFINNTQASIAAVSVNQDGSLIASRDGNATYFVNRLLRLRGTYDAADIQGGTGLAVHPDISFDAPISSTNWAAIGGAAPEVILVEPRNFRRVGRIPLLERVGGPLRVIRRLVSDPADVVAHIFGVTASGAVFEVPVRTSDINP